MSQKEKKQECYANRELSWLKFNERVLDEAASHHVPLCERMAFFSIFQSNLDEFFMVRVGALYDQMLADNHARENKTWMTSAEQLQAILRKQGSSPREKTISTNNIWRNWKSRG